MKQFREGEFIPECHADTTLLLFFKISIRKINHADGIHRVSRAMEQQQKNFHKVLVGLIDNDKKNTPTYFGSFKLIASENNLLIKRHPQFNHYLFLLNPEFERWLLNAADSVGVQAKDFGFPDNPRKLHDVTQQVNIGKNENFLAFLKAIREAEADAFLTLQTMIDNILQGKL